MASQQADSSEPEGDNEDHVITLMEMFPLLSFRQLRAHCDLFPPDVEFEFLVDSLIDVQPDGGTPPQELEDDAAQVAPAETHELAQIIEPAEIHELGEMESEPEVEIIWSSKSPVGPRLPSRPSFRVKGRSVRPQRLGNRETVRRVRKDLPLQPKLDLNCKHSLYFKDDSDFDKDDSDVDVPGPSHRSAKDLPLQPKLDLNWKHSRYFKDDSDFDEDDSDVDVPGPSHRSAKDLVMRRKLCRKAECESHNSEEEDVDVAGPSRRVSMDSTLLEEVCERFERSLDSIGYFGDGTELAKVSAESLDLEGAVGPQPPEDAPLVIRLAEMFPDSTLETLAKFCDENRDLSLEQLVSEFLLRQDAQEAAELPDSADSDPDQLDDTLDDDAVAGALAEEVLEIPEEPGVLEMINRYQELLTLFPSADPDFLRENAERLTDETVPDFVARTLETEDYPREEEYRARERLRRLRVKYVERFDAAAFLQEHPDPAEHFGTRKLKSSEELTTKMVSYLTERYKESTQEQLRKVLEHNGGCLSRACVEAGVGTAVDDWFDMFSNNEEMLPEVAFIEHRPKVELVRRRLAHSKQVAVEVAQHNSETLACGCCYGDMFLINEMAACQDGHLFCKECIERAANVAIGQGQFKLACLEDCGKEFSVNTLKSVLKRSMFLRMEQRRQFEEVHSAEIPDLETCPACDFSAIPRPDDIVFNCLNPDCQLSTCRKCREPSHIPLHCDELPEKEEHTRIRTQLEDRMTQALIRECWKCKKKFVKSDGCNKMQCTCGALMCYLCRQPVKDYSHFNGPGGDNFDKCELFSNNEKLHVDAVREEALKARAEVLAVNPNLELKYDPTLLLP